MAVTRNAARPITIALVAAFGLLACTRERTRLPSFPGEEEFHPTSRPADVDFPGSQINLSCSVEAACPDWYCVCADRTVVNAAFCDEQFCLSAAAICPIACETLGHGPYAGVAGGGTLPDVPLSADAGVLDSDLSAESCPEAPPVIGEPTACDRCAEQFCCSELTTCFGSQACLDYWDCLIEHEDTALCNMMLGEDTDYWDLALCVSLLCTSDC